MFHSSFPKQPKHCPHPNSYTKLHLPPLLYILFPPGSSTSAPSIPILSSLFIRVINLSSATAQGLHPAALFTIRPPARTCHSHIPSSRSRTRIALSLHPNPNPSPPPYIAPVSSLVSVPSIVPVTAGASMCN